MDGSTEKFIVTGIVVDADEPEEEDEEVLSKYKTTGSKRTFLLAEVQGVPENRHSYEIILKSLNFASLAKDTQIVCVLKLVSILLGIQTATSMQGPWEIFHQSFQFH